MTNSAAIPRAIQTSARSAYRRNRSSKAPRVLFGIGRWTALAVLLSAVLFPFTWMIVSSIKPNAEVLIYPPRLLPQNPTFENFSAIFSGVMGRGFFNSILAAGVSTILVLVLATPAAYALSAHRFPGDAGKTISLGFLLLRFLPPFAILVPMFVLMRTFGLIDSPGALILVYTAIHLPIGIWVLRPAIRAIPSEVLEAAQMDGAGPFRVFWSIVTPLVRPALATTAAFCAIFAWNEFIFALVLTQNRGRTYTVLAASFVTEAGPQWGMIAATAVIACIPIAALCVFLNRHLISGLAAGAVR